jgi:hypothetical protein
LAIAWSLKKQKLAVAQFSLGGSANEKSEEFGRVITAQTRNLGV